MMIDRHKLKGGVELGRAGLAGITGKAFGGSGEQVELHLFDVIVDRSNMKELGAVQRRVVVIERQESGEVLVTLTTGGPLLDQNTSCQHDSDALIARIGDDMDLVRSGVRV